MSPNALQPEAKRWVRWSAPPGPPQKPTVLSDFENLHIHPTIVKHAKQQNKIGASDIGSTQEAGEATKDACRDDALQMPKIASLNSCRTAHNSPQESQELLVRKIKTACALHPDGGVAGTDSQSWQPLTKTLLLMFTRTRQG